MATAVTIYAQEDGMFDSDTVEDGFAQYFRGLQEGRFAETDTVQFCVRTAPEIPNVTFDILPICYLGFTGSYPDVNELAVAEEDSDEEEAEEEE